VFLIRVLRKAVRCNGVVSFNHTCKKYLLLYVTGTYGLAWVEYSSCEDDVWDCYEISLKLKKVDEKNNGRHSEYFVSCSFKCFIAFLEGNYVIDFWSEVNK